MGGRAIPAVIDRFGGLDILVNNAGVGIVEPLDVVTLESWHKTMSVNVDGVFLGTKHGMAAMRGGRLDHQPLLDPGLYEHSGAVRPTARARGRSGSSPRRRRWTAPRMSGASGVNSIHPGYIHTEMMEATCYPRLRQP